MGQAENYQGTSGRPVLSIEEKEAFILRALDAMAQYTFGFICSVHGLPGTNLGRHYGTALRCTLNGRRAILTAHHVIEGARREPYGLAISTGHGEAPYVVHGEVHIVPAADLAVFFLPDDYPDKPFWPAARIDRTLDKLSTDYLFLHGFPAQQSYSSRLLGGALSKSLPYGAMQRLDDLPPNLRAHEFAIDYDFASVLSVCTDPIDPHGLSGSPVWRIGASGRSTREWKPEDSLLVGVLTQWGPMEKVVVATTTAGFAPGW